MSVIRPVISNCISPCIGSVFGDSSGYGDDLVMEFNIASDNETLTIPGGPGTYLFDIDWGDGTVETGLTTEGAGPHTYTDARPEAVVRISGTFPHLRFNNNSNVLKLRKILNLGDVGWTSIAGAFRGHVLNTDVRIGVTDTSAVSSGTVSFAEGKSVVNADLTGINTSTFTDMTSFFLNWNVILAEDAPYVGHFDTSNVEVMSHTFYAWTLAVDMDIGLDQWQIPKVMDFTNFLSGSQLSTSAYDRTLASWGNQTLAAGAASTTIHFGNSTYTDQASKDLLLAQCAGIIDGGVAP